MSETLSPSLTDVENLDILSSLHPTEYDGEFPYTPDQVTYFSHALHTGDKLLEQSPIITTVLPAVEAQKIINTTLEKIFFVMSMKPQSNAVGLLYGASGMISRLKYTFQYHNPSRITSAVVTRSNGIDLNGTGFYGSFRDEFIAGDGPIIIVDDLADKVVGLTIAASHVMAAQSGSSDLLHQDAQLIQDMLYGNNTYHDRKQRYVQLIQRLIDGNILLAFPFSKNPEFYALLKEYVQKNDTVHQRLQGDLLYQTVEIDPQKWIMGQRIDTGVLVADQLEAIRHRAPNLLQEPAIGRLFEGLDGSMFRYGAWSESIIALKRTGEPDNRFQNLLEWRTTLWIAQLEDYLRVRERNL